MYEGTLTSHESSPAKYIGTLENLPEEGTRFIFKFGLDHSDEEIVYTYTCFPKNLYRIGNTFFWRINGYDYELHIEDDNTLSIWE